METKNCRGQCAVEMAVVAAGLTFFILWFANFAKSELKSFARVQLSGGRR